MKRLSAIYKLIGPRQSSVILLLLLLAASGCVSAAFYSYTVGANIGCPYIGGDGSLTFPVKIDDAAFRGADGGIVILSDPSAASVGATCFWTPSDITNDQCGMIRGTLQRNVWTGSYPPSRYGDYRCLLGTSIAGADYATDQDGNRLDLVSRGTGTLSVGVTRDAAVATITLRYGEPPPVDEETADPISLQPVDEPAPAPAEPMADTRNPLQVLLDGIASIFNSILRIFNIGGQS
jgi:hypothetical protein